VPAISAPRALAASLILSLAGLTTAIASASPAHEPLAQTSKYKYKDKDKDTGSDDARSSAGDDGAADLSSTKSKDKAKSKDDEDRGGYGGSTTTAPAPTVPATPTSSTPAPTVPGATPGDLAAPPAAPALGVTVGLAGVSGTVVVRSTEGATLQPLAGAMALPTGAHVDARNGAVALTSAVDAAGTTQTGEFSGGIFEVRQAPTGRGVTQIVLLGGAWGHCRSRAATAPGALAHTAAAKKRQPIRRLWGTDDHGRFQTRGRGSVATVRGTKWLTEDFCDGTRTTVTEGAVAVRNRATGRTVVVRAGHSHFAAVR
jgi:hypothetical protein